MGKSKEKRAEKFSQVIIEPMLNNEMTFNEAFEYMLSYGEHHWHEFEKLQTRRGRVESAKKCAVINASLKNLQAALSEWNFEKAHRKFKRTAR